MTCPTGASRSIADRVVGTAATICAVEAGAEQKSRGRRAPGPCRGRRHGERPIRSRRSRGRKQQLRAMRHEERTILNRRVGIWQFIVVVAVAIVLALIVSIVVGNVPAH